MYYTIIFTVVNLAELRAYHHNTSRLIFQQERKECNEKNKCLFFEELYKRHYK
jgi:hypothetical protein